MRVGVASASTSCAQRTPLLLLMPWCGCGIIKFIYKYILLFFCKFLNIYRTSGGIILIVGCLSVHEYLLGWCSGFLAGSSRNPKLRLLATTQTARARAASKQQSGEKHGISSPLIFFSLIYSTKLQKGSTSRPQEAHALSFGVCPWP